MTQCFICQNRACGPLVGYRQLVRAFIRRYLHGAETRDRQSQPRRLADQEDSSTIWRKRWPRRRGSEPVTRLLLRRLLDKLRIFSRVRHEIVVVATNSERETRNDQSTGL